MAFTAANTKFATSGQLGADLDGTSSANTQGIKLGTTVEGTDGTEWIFVQANGAITQFDAVGIDENYQAAALTKAMADDGWGVGFAQVAFSDNEYGWVATKGTDIGCNLLINCAADVALYTTGTAGKLDDTSTSQTKIDGVVSVSTITAATSAEIIATHPKSTTF
jgi:hypothetical protein